MIGAIIGDTVGSRFEFFNIYTKGFEFLADSCYLTDDSVMTLALAEAIIRWEDCGGHAKYDYAMLSDLSVKAMRKWGKRYPNAGYGNRFSYWLANPSVGPYNSCGNGAAMRVSPVGWAARDLEDCIAMSRAVTEVTHNHSDGIKGAESTAVQIFLARNGKGIQELREYEESHYYPIEHNLDWLSNNYGWVAVCDGTCQPAFSCLYESTGFEDAIRNCMWIGGDCDTTGAICGAIAEAVWGVPKDIQAKIREFMDPEQLAVLNEFQQRFIRNETIN